MPVIFVSIMMFFIPKDFNFLRSWSKDRKYIEETTIIRATTFLSMIETKFVSLFIYIVFLFFYSAAERPFKSSEGLITWDVIQRKMPWSLMFLLGGGFAISRGSMASGLAKKIGEALVPLRHLPPFFIMLIVCFFIGTITEFTSNVGIANITLPVIAQMVKNYSNKTPLFDTLPPMCRYTILLYCYTVRCDGHASHVFDGTGNYIVFFRFSITGWYTTECNYISCWTCSDTISDGRRLRSFHLWPHSKLH